MGWPSVAWGLAHTSSQELTEWEAYTLLEPTGFVMENYRFGASMALLANVNRDPDETDAYSPEDFMYDYERLSEEVADSSLEHGVKDEIDKELTKAEVSKERVKSEQMKSMAQAWAIAKGN